MMSYSGSRKELPEHVREQLRQNSKMRISPFAMALMAFLACPLLALVAGAASWALLLAWPVAPVWLFIVTVRENRKEDEAIIADDRVWVAAFPGEPGCSVISELHDSMEAERSHGMIVEAVPRSEGRRRMIAYLEWIDAQRVVEGKEPLWTPARL